MSFSQDLVVSAFSLLQAALEERTKPVWREERNHYTHHAPGALVLIVSGFDVWATEFTLGLDPWDEELRSYSERPICQRYADLLRRLSVAPPPHESDLRACVDARDEIVHYLPRMLPDRALPSWIAALDTRGLLIKSPHLDCDFTLSQKLCSYALAHWTFATISTCVRSLVEAAPADQAPFVGEATAANFYAIQTIPPPEALAEFDVHHRLMPTRGTAQHHR